MLNLLGFINRRIERIADRVALTYVIRFAELVAEDLDKYADQPSSIEGRMVLKIHADAIRYAADSLYDETHADEKKTGAETDRD